MHEGGIAHTEPEAGVTGGGCRKVESPRSAVTSNKVTATGTGSEPNCKSWEGQVGASKSQ